MIDYDTLADDYARHRTAHPGVLEQLVAAADEIPGSRVLEVGIGTGNVAAALQALSDCEIYGVDASAEMLHIAAGRIDRNRLFHTSAETLDVPVRSFDLIYSVDVIHHLQDRASYFQRARQELRAGGRIVTVTDCWDDLRQRVPLTRYFPESLAVEMKRYPRIERLQHEMQAAGLTDIHTTHTRLEYDLVDAAPFRARVHSSLLLIDETAYQRGLAALEEALQAGPVRAVSLYTLLWGKRPD